MRKRGRIPVIFLSVFPVPRSAKVWGRDQPDDLLLGLKRMTNQCSPRERPIDQFESLLRC